MLRGLVGLGDVASWFQFRRFLARVAIEDYLRANPDIQSGISEGAFCNARHHLLRHGIAEICDGRRSVYAGIPLFSAQSYLEANPDVRGAVEAGQVGSPSQHFLNYGIFEGRLQPNTALPQREFSLLTAPAGSHWIVAAPKCVEPEVSIIIAAFNNPEKTLSCISSVIQNTVLERYEIVVVDDCSTDDEARALYRRTENVHWVHNEENFGYLVSCNLGARHAVGRYLLFLNNDTNVTKGCIDELLGSDKKQQLRRSCGPETGLPRWATARGWGCHFCIGTMLELREGARPIL